MTHKPFSVLLIATLLTACGGSGDGAFVPGGGSCSVAAEKNFVLDVTRDWYLFPDLLPERVNVNDYATAQELLDALTATARAQGIDRNFSYVTTRQADDSFLQEGEFIGFGFRFRIDEMADRAYFIDVYESSPAAEAGLARGAELLAIDSGSGFVPMAAILATDPNLDEAFGPAEEGVERSFRFLKDGVTTEATLTKRIVTIQPVPDDGVEVLTLPSNPAVRVGYVNLRSYISSAETPLRDAFASLRIQGIDYFIFDLRYNGGGLLSVAGLVGDLFGANRNANDVQYRLRFNPARSANDDTRLFRAQPQSVSPVRIAFITTGATASASELTINSLKPWLDTANVALIGDDTFGKPVGQSAFDLTGCDTRLRLVTFRIANRDDESDYYTGLADTLMWACTAADDITHPMSAPDEASTAAALSWIEAGACPGTMLGAAAALQKPGLGVRTRYPVPSKPAPAQTHLPGLY